jgi:hypothetical protein
MQAVQVQLYLNRARDFLKGMDLLQNDLVEYRYSSALLAIHGAISYSDALRIGLEKTSLASDDHQNAIKKLKELLSSRQYKKLEGLNHLTNLVSNKGMVAYRNNALREGTCKSIIDHAERFAVWAEETGKTLKIEGWRDESS